MHLVYLLRNEAQIYSLTIERENGKNIQCQQNGRDKISRKNISDRPKIGTNPKVAIVCKSFLMANVAKKKIYFLNIHIYFLDSQR